MFSIVQWGKVSWNVAHDRELVAIFHGQHDDTNKQDERLPSACCAIDLNVFRPSFLMVPWRFCILAFIVILLLEFEANLKGIVIDDHRQASEVFPWPCCLVASIVFVRLEAEHVIVQPQFVTTSMAK